MTAAHPLRRFLARICSADTMTRIVDPTLADVRFERDRPAWLGYAALARALSVHAITSVPARTRQLWQDDGRGLPRAAAFMVAAAFVCALPFVMLPIVGDVRNHFVDNNNGAVVPRSAQSLSMFLLLLPQALAVTLAPAVLAALPLALRQRRMTSRLAWRFAGLAVLVCAAMAVLINWGAPTANQRYRVLISGNPRLDPGENESSLRALHEQMKSLERSPHLTDESRMRVQRGMEYRYQMRLAMIASPVPLALGGLVLAASRAARRRPRATGIFAMVGYVFAIVALDGVASSLLVRFPTLPPAALAWLPGAAITVLACVMWRASDAAPDAECA